MAGPRRAIRLAAGALLAATLVPARAQIFEIRPPAMPAGSAAVTVRLQTDDGRPAAGAKVSLHAHAYQPPLYESPRYSPKEGLTDAGGAYTFASLPDAVFVLRAALSGFPDIEFGQVQPGLAGTPIRLATGEHLTVAQRFVRGAAISGTALDHLGRLAPRVTVHAFRLEPMSDTETVLGSGGSAETDDRGEYRIAHLPPGTYVVLGYRTRPDTEREPPLHQIEPGVWALERGGYVPGGTSADLAERITLAGQQERPGVLVQLKMSPVTTIRGVVRHADGRPAQGVPISLVPTENEYLSHGRATTDVNGRFELARVDPGEFRVSAHAVPRVPLVASARVTTDGRTPREVSLDLTPGATIEGTVVFDRSLPSTPVRPINVWLGRAAGGSSHDVPGVPSVNVSGDFSFAGVPPGPHRFRASGAGMIAASALVSGRDALDFPFEVRGDEIIRDVVITVTDRISELSGVVRSREGRASVNHTVVVFPADEQFWTPGSRRIAYGRPDTTGRYLMRGLPAGDYLVALAAPDLFGCPPTSTLRSLRGRAVPVALRSGERRTQDINAQ